MVSPPTTADSASPRHAMDRRVNRHLRRRLDPFPRSRLQRWLFRLILSVPLVAAALAVHAAGEPIAGTPNQALLDRVAQIDWSSGEALWLGQLYPPISSLMAVVIPGGRLGLALAGALVGGIFVQKILEIMVQRRFHRSTSAILAIALTLNPLFFYTALEDLAGFLGLMFFGLAVADVVRFVSWANTQAGFRAGIWFMLAALTDLSAVFYVLAAAAVAPFLDLGRQRQRGARASTLLVIAFPTVAAVASLMFLNLIFVRNPLGNLGEVLIAGVGERFAELPALFASPGGLLLLAPVASAWVVALIVGRWGTIPASSLIFLSVMAAYVLGLQPPGSAGTVFIMMTLLAMAFIPTARRRRTTVLLDLVAVAQIAIAWLAALSSPTVREWMAGLVGSGFSLPGF